MRTAGAIVLALAVLLGGCELVDDLDDEAAEFDDEFPDPDDDLDESDGGADATTASCSRRELGEDAEAVFRVAHRVVDGELRGPCLGGTDAQLIEVWDTLAAMTSVAMRDDLTLFSLFDGDPDSEDATLAFVTAVDDSGTGFHMAVEATIAEDDPDELLLTMAHEFSHVFTGTAAQLDRTIPVGACHTYDNGEGCYRAGAYVLRWIEAFWPEDLLAEVDTTGEQDVADGEDRCALDAGFLGPYAATTPEEDFAESFAAFVLDVEPANVAQAERLAWFEDEAELADVRARARAAALGPLANEFETCG